MTKQKIFLVSILSFGALSLLSFDVPLLALEDSKHQEKLNPNGPLMYAGEGKPEALAKLNLNALKRLDFRVEGASCAICLGRIRKRLESAKGIAKVAVAIQKPYGVAVIYDSTKTEKDKIFQAGLKGEKEKVLFLDDHEEKLDKMPFILIPKFNSLVKSES